MTYATDVADSHLKMANWELDEGDLSAGACSKPADLSNTGFHARWNNLKKSQEVHMYGPLYADSCNVPKLIVNGVKKQIKLTKAKPAFYLMSNKEDSKVYFKILEALLYIKRIRPNAGIFTAHNETTRGLSCPIQLYKNRNQDLHICRRFAITLHEQRGPGSTPKTFDYHHGQEHRLSRQYVFESFQLPTL